MKSARWSDSHPRGRPQFSLSVMTAELWVHFPTIGYPLSLTA